LGYGVAVTGLTEVSLGILWEISSMFVAKRLKSLENLRTVDVRDTKTAPVRIRASDLKNYMVKAQTHPTSKGVIKEWLCGHFLKIWNLPVPDFAVIDVQKHHVPPLFHKDYQPFHFDRPAFGSLMDSNALDVNEVLDSPEAYQKGLSNSEGELLLIALFDLWTSNVDRHEDNYNMIYSGDAIPKFRPIDHEMALDFLDFGHPPELQTENESLIDSVLFRTYVSAKRRKKVISDTEHFDQFVDKTTAIRQHLPRIISAMPAEWQTPVPGLENRLLETIFAPDWLDKTWRTYLRGC
jgi:hypothetical protein